MALNRSPVLIYVHQSCSVEGNDLNHLVEDNQAGLFSSIVFERITRPYHLPHHTQTFSTYQIKALALVVSDKVFSCFPKMGLSKTCDPGWANFVPQGQNFNILGIGQLGDVT